MTGRFPHRNGAVGFEPISEEAPTLQEQLRRAGYFNAIIGKRIHLAPSWKFCWDMEGDAADEEYGDGRNPELYYRFTKECIGKAKASGQPFYLMANSHDPHRPFAGSQQELKSFGFRSKVSRQYRPDEMPVPGFLPELPEISREIAEYFTSVHRCDETVGAVLRALKESGEENNTLVMFLSDNGMAFPFAKTNCYLTSTRTPWLIRWPGVVQEGYVDPTHFISGIDYMPTILDALNLPLPDGVDGESFLPLIKVGAKLDTGESRMDVFTVFNQTSVKKNYPMRCVQNQTYGYIYNAWSDQKEVFVNESQTGLTFRAMQVAAGSDQAVAERVKFFQYRVKEELYRFSDDPNALQNLVGEEPFAEVLEQMRERLYLKMDQADDPLLDRYSTEIYGHSIKGGTKQ
jgi:N-sulfoglucosamine sulfohydrolase